jgi:hypothetical protein
MARLDLAAVKGARDLKQVEVSVPEWGEGATVALRGLTGTERDAFEASAAERHEKGGIRAMSGIRAYLVALTLLNEKGERMFPDADAGAVELGGKSGLVIKRLADVAMSISGLSNEKVEEILRDFPVAPSAGSGSN